MAQTQARSRSRSHDPGPADDVATEVPRARPACRRVARSPQGGRPRVRPIHSETMSGAASAATRSIQGKPNQSAATSGPRTATAERSQQQAPKPLRAPWRGVSRRRRHSAVRAGGIRRSPVPDAPRRNPAKSVDEHQFGIGALPEQEIADALLAAGADQQIGIGHTRRQQIAPNSVSSMLAAVQLAGRRPRRARLRAAWMISSRGAIVECR